MRTYTLNFVDAKKSSDRIIQSHQKSGLSDACRAGVGKLDNHPEVIACMDFTFIGGSMGSVVGERLSRAINHSRKHKIPLIIISQSGGARMRSEEHTSELQSRGHLLCRLL